MMAIGIINFCSIRKYESALAEFIWYNLFDEKLVIK